ncbi:MAG: ComF family protein [bacterium]|nr:ComF family protein [bacterium]
MWKRFKNQILDLLLPQFCLRCQKEGFLICSDCLSLIDINRKSYKEPCLDKVFSAIPYQDPLVKKMILLFKYEPYIKNFALPLATLIIYHFSLIEKQPSGILIPVPITNKKIRERGYNQSAVLAKILSMYYQMPFSGNNLIKVKNTKSQADLGRAERQENVLNAFAIKSPDLISEKTIFLVDDVYTTGSTMQECARVLRMAGASKVYGIVVAREE